MASFAVDGRHSPSPTAEEKPLALRKTSRLTAGLNMYRVTANTPAVKILSKVKQEKPDSHTAFTMARSSQLSEAKAESSADGNRNKRRMSDQSNSPGGKKKKPTKEMARHESSQEERQNDNYCWSCHKEGILVGCVVCPRAYHIKCASLEKDPDKDWVCPECNLILKAENVDLRSSAMQALSIDQLCNLLKFAVSRMRMQCPDEFLRPVPLDLFPNYSNFVVHPMDLETLEKNIKQRMYGCTESFIADTKWILHNCIIFNGYHHKLTSMAKALLKICKHEMSEIEVCPDCYSNAYTKRENWFQEPCCPPHLLIWAKLKGFPFWPAKAMRVVTGNVDVRFFGAHDRAWIPVSQCFLLSKDIPTTMKIKKKGVFEHSMEELAQHINKVKDRFQVFQYAPFRSPLVAQDLNIHIQSMLPGVNLKDYCRSSVGTFRYQGAVRQSPSSECSPFSSKDRGFMADSRTIKKELIVSLSTTSTSKDASTSEEHHTDSRKTTDGGRPDPCKVLKPRLECMKKLEVAIEKIKSFGKDYDMINIKYMGKASTSVQLKKSDKSNEPANAAKSFLVSAAETATSAETAESEVEKSEMDITDSPKSTATDACEVSSTTCVVDGFRFPEELPICVSTSLSPDNPNAPVTALESLEMFVETKLPDTDKSCAKDPENIVENTDTSEPKENSSKSELLTSEEMKPQNTDSDEQNQIGSGCDVPNTDQQNNPQLDLGEPVNNCDTVDTPKAESALFSSNQRRDEDISALELEHRDENDNRTEGSSCEASSPDMADAKEPEKLENNVVPDSIESEQVPKENASEELEKNVSLDVRSLNTNSVPNNDNDYKSGKATNSNVIDKDAQMPTEKDSRSEIAPVPLTDEGDLVIDLDRDKEEDASHAAKAKKRNSRSPFGGIKLKEKTATKDKKHPLATKSKSKSSPSERQLMDLTGCSSGVAPNAAPICSNLPMLSPLGIRNSISVLQAQQVSRSMPTLHPRPPITTTSAGTSQPSTSSTGLNKYSQKVVDFVRGTMEEMFHELAKTGNPEATIKTLQLEMEKMQWHHQQELSEMKHNTDLILLEMRNSMESEKQRIVTEIRRQCELEKQKAIEETKKKQWCAYCGKEAIFYCCWNTSYCDYPCQQAHWPRHVSVCSQTQVGSEQSSKDFGSPTNGGSARTQQHHKQNAKNAKKSEMSSDHQQQQLLVGHPQMQGSGAINSALASVQVIPQNSMRAGPLQVQYIGSSPQSSVHPNISIQGPTMTAQFATVATPSGFSVAQGISGSPQGAMFQHRPMQGSNLLFPVVSTHQTRPIMHPSHLPHNTQVLFSHGMRSQPSMSFIRGPAHPHRVRPYL